MFSLITIVHPQEGIDASLTATLLYRMILSHLVLLLLAAPSSRNHVPPPNNNMPPASWQAGQDVSGDFQRLEQAIRSSEADFRSIYQQRQSVLQQFAPQQRQLYRPWLRRTILAPWMTAVGLSLVKVPLLQHWCHQLLRIQFFTCVVATPLALLFVQQRRKKRVDSIPTTSETRRVMTFTRRKKVPAVDDLRTCLLEQWTTAAIGSLFLGPMISPLHRVMVRLAALCSMYQFPRLAYELQQTQRPVDGLSYVLQNAMAVLVSPWWLAIEIGSSGVPPAVLWGMTGALGLAYAFPLLVQHRNVIAKSFALGVLGRYYVRRDTIFSIMEWLATFRSLPHRMASLWMCGRWAGPWIVSAMALLGPLIHMAALSQLIQVKLMHNVSLTMNATEMEASLQQPPSWYSSLTWREPERMRMVIRTAKERWMYNFLFEGSVDEQLREERKRQLRKEEVEGMRVWERLEYSNATQWKDNAMQRLANQHQHDYENGTYAVRRTNFLEQT